MQTLRILTQQRKIYVVSRANLEYFGVPNNEEESYANHWISHFAENVSATSLSVFVDITAL
jgi:hypothetical protein